MNLTTATTILSMTATTSAGILLACTAGQVDAPEAPTPVDRPSVAETVPDLPKRFKDCRADWDSKDIPGSVVIYRAGIVERVPTAEGWAPLAFFGGTETTTDDHWILGSCTRVLDAPDHA